MYKTIFSILLFFFVSAAHAQAPVQVILSTSKGDITLELYPDKAPKTVKNFLKYVDEGFYIGTIFHRVISNFMIQGGGYTKNMEKRSTLAPVENEADNGLKNNRGTIAMARTNDPHSATSQFFINHKTNNFLNYKSKTSHGWGYCVFGKVIKGMEVVDAIAASKTTANAPFAKDVPEETIEILDVRIAPAKSSSPKAKTTS